MLAADSTIPPSVCIRYLSFGYNSFPVADLPYARVLVMWSKAALDIPNVSKSEI